MSVKFTPRFTITACMVKKLQRIEILRSKIEVLLLSPKHLKAAQKRAKEECINYFRIIEDLKPNGELHDYLLAIELVDTWVKEQVELSEKNIKILHAALMGQQVSRYRPGQNGVLDGATKEVVYLPPKAKDVPVLMDAFIEWFSLHPNLSPVLAAGIAHFAINMIHPYYDGNGRTARLVTRFILQRGGYGIRGLLCLEKYYADDLYSYYTALEVGGVKCYYSGRAEVTITSWLEYFLTATATSFELALQRARARSLHG